MTRDLHQQARQWIALGAADAISDAERSQLQAHLRGCASCHEYADATTLAIRSLRSVPMTAGPSLVRITQTRVRMRVQQLRQHQERVWLVAMICSAVAFSAAVTTPIVWRIFSWLGAWAGISSPVWQTGFTAFLIAPALLVSVLLLARGKQATHDAGPWQS